MYANNYGVWISPWQRSITLFNSRQKKTRSRHVHTRTYLKPYVTNTPLHIKDILLFIKNNIYDTHLRTCIYNTQMHSHMSFSSSDGNSLKADVTSLSNLNYTSLLLAFFLSPKQHLHVYNGKTIVDGWDRRKKSFFFFLGLPFQRH